MIQAIDTTTKKTLISSPVSDFIPHSEPMVLIDRVVDFEANKLQAEVSITEQSRFYDANLGGVENLVAIEYMAQAIAALAGIRSQLNNQSVKLGFLLGTRKMELHQAVLEQGKRYQVEVEELFMDDSGLGAFQCAITFNGEMVAEAKLNVFETNDENQLLR
ncbi:hotdog family protein [Kangiella japonica]|uniref:Hotdog family protein n=1 Tax=Kangiella japonica TaxID=647384 RepID=A0ABN0T0S3_9GAMM